MPWQSATRRQFLKRSMVFAPLLHHSSDQGQTWSLRTLMAKGNDNTREYGEPARSLSLCRRFEECSAGRRFGSR